MAKSQGDDVDPSPEPTPNPSGSGQSKKRRPVRDGLGFFGSFLKNPTSVGAVLPSSR
ncbi:MAG: hypothetical protein ACI91B_002568, partial [Planctomycetota bacterium]